MKRHLRIILSSTLAIILLFFFFKGTNFRALLYSLKQANPFYLIGFALFLPLFYFLRAIRWRILFDGESRPPLKIFFLANIVGFSINYILPGRLGEIGRALYVSRKGKISSSYSIGTVVVERFFDAFSMGLLLLFYLILFPMRSGQLKENLYIIILVSFAAVLLLVAGIIIMELMIKKGIKAPFIFLLKMFPERFRGKIKNSARSLIYGMNFLNPPYRAIAFVVLGLIVWISVVVQYWIGLRAFSVSRPPVEIIPFTAVLLVGVSIPTPGMAGGFEVASKFFIMQVWHYPQSVAVAATLTLHLLLLIGTLSMGAIIGIKESMLVTEGGEQ